VAENDSGLFGGSVDRSRLEDMKAAAGDDPERQARVAEVQAQVDAVAESDKAAEDARQKAAGEVRETEAEPEESAATEPAPEPPPEPAEDLSALTKTELVERAHAAGIATDGKTKAELVQDLEAANRGDYNLP
jgi:hypothetical protein